MEPDRTRGVVISLHALGAAIRLEDGRLASASAAEVDRHRAAYGRSLERRMTLTFMRLGPRGVTLAESVDESVAAQAAQPARLSDAAFELQIANYLKETESWAPADRPAPLERHLFRKKLRAKAFQNE
ncbi:MAG: hypothetical protein WCE44_06735 [Candidatus Velthaea sp.]|jgi:hypothetical protein